MALVVVGFLGLAAPADAAIGPGDAGYIPPGRTAVIVGQQNPPAADAYVRATGRQPAGFMYYQPLELPPQAHRENLAWIENAVTPYPGASIQLGLTLGPSPLWSTLTGNPQLPGALQVMAGAYDANIDELARWLNGIDREVFLRIGYEFDLLGGQWGVPPVYIAAYRHVVDRLRASGVDNVAYVWHSAGAFFRAFDYSGISGLLGSADPSHGGLDPVITAIVEFQRSGAELLGITPDLLPISLFYPGDDYVDYFGLSYWDDSCCFARSSPAARRIYRERSSELLEEAEALGLPSIMGESTPAYIGTTGGAESVNWLRDYFQLIEDHDVRATAMIFEEWQQFPLWTNPIWGAFWPDSRIDASPEVCREWVRLTSGPRYIDGPRVAEPEPACALPGGAAAPAPPAGRAAKRKRKRCHKYKRKPRIKQRRGKRGCRRAKHRNQRDRRERRKRATA